MPDNNHMDFGVDLLPVTDKGYSLGKSDKRWKIFADEIDGTIKANNIMPISSKDFTTGKYGQDGTGTHYYETLGTITPDVFEKMWLLRYIISIEVPNDTTYTYRADVSFYGVRNTYSAYKIFNSYYSKYPIYQHFLVEGSSSSYPHEFGYRLASSYGDTTLNKNVTIDIIETRNCTVSFFDSPKAYTSTAPTNYTYRTFNATSNGLQETSDDNTITRLYAGNNTMKTSTTMRLAGSSLYGFDRDNRAQGISLYNNGYDSTTTSINTARVYNTAGFDWTKGLFYNTGGNYATNSDIYPGIDQSNHAIDLRYTDNCVNSSSLSTLGIERYKAIYLRGTLGSDGLFYLAPITVTYNNASYKRAWTQDIPSTEDGYVYWFLGFPYYNSSYAGGYQFNFYLNNNLYWYHDGKFQEYATPITKASIGLGNVENTALSTWTGSNKITTVGTITTGTWNGTTIAVANGGTGATSASGARTNLGLGAAAVKGVTDNSSNADVTSSDTNLITGRTLYYQLAKKGYTTNTGTVTSVRVQASSPLQSSVNTAQSSSLDTTISFTNQNANVVLAGPSSGSSAAAPTFRALVAADIPSLDWSKIGSGKPTTLSGYGITDAAASGHTQAVNKGGTNITSYTIGDLLYASASTTLSKLAGNTTTTVKYLKSVATTSGTAVAPAWAQIAASEISGLGTAAVKGVTDNSSNADVTSSDTNLITGRTLYYQLANKGYTTNTGTVTSVGTGVGLTGGSITTSGTIKANLTSDTALSNAAQSVTESASRVYPVRIDKNSKLAVVVPWTDTNTLVNYSLAATTKAYLMASSNAPTSTKTAREAIGDTGVYLTATSGELSSLRYSWHDTSSTPVEKAYTVWNSTDLSIDFVFN